MCLSNRIQPRSPVPAIVALCVAVCGISAVSAQTYLLPNVGSVNDCASTVRAFAGGHGNQSCAQTQGTVLPQRLKEPSFQAKCPAGQPLRGLLNNTCTDKPNVHPPHPMASNYNTTLCCGYAQPAPPMPQSYSAPPPVHHAATTVDAPPHRPTQFFKVANVPLRMGASNASGCPQVGATYRHVEMPQTLFFRGLERRINGECKSRGSPYGYYSVRLNSCTETVDPQRPPQVHFQASADIFCAR